MNAITPTRRQVLLATLSAAGGLAIGIGPAQAIDTGATIWDRDPPAGAQEVTAWVVVEPDNSILIRVKQAGDGARRADGAAAAGGRRTRMRLEPRAGRIRLVAPQPG